MITPAKTKSPCIGICSTGVGDSVCRGCKRFVHEVVDWNGYSEVQRRTISLRLSMLAQQVTEHVIEIVDESVLREQLRYQHIRFDESAGPYLWLIELLQVGASTIEDLTPFGCRVRDQYVGQSLVSLRDQIDADLFVLSDVHYQRYFAGLK